MQYKIYKNAIRCRRCGAEAVSTHVHHYAKCACGACAADGGKEYLRRTFQCREDLEERSEIAWDPALDPDFLERMRRDGVAEVYTLTNGSLTVSVSARGAELRSLRSADGNEYLWQGDGQYWSGQAPLLFPFVGRMPGKRYTMDGCEYEIDIHGFAKDSMFSVESMTDTAITFLLTDTEQTLKAYPRRFALRVSYSLEENRLVTSCRVTNRDEKTMFFGIGGHPAFCLPMEKGTWFEDYSLSFPEAGECRRILFSENGLTCGAEAFPGGALKLSHSLFDNDAVVLEGAGHTVCLSSGYGKRSVTLRFPGMAYIGFWHTPRTEAPFVCIEPWQSLPAAEGQQAVAEEIPGLVHLKPAADYDNFWTIEIQ